MVSYAHPENAGLTALVRQSALNTIVRQYMPSIQSKISSIALPDYENNIENVKISIQDITIQTLSCEPVDVAIKTSNSISFSLVGCQTSLRMFGGWDTQLFGVNVGDHTWANTDITFSLVATSQIQLEDGKPEFSWIFHVNVLSVAIDLESNLKDVLFGWIENVFQDQLENLVQQLMQDKITTAANDEFAKLMENFQLRVPLNNFGALNFNLTNITTSENDNIAVAAAVTVETLNGTLIERDAPIIPFLSSFPENDVHFGIAAGVLSSLGEAFFDNGNGTISISGEQIPPGISLIQLTTQRFLTEIPQLHAQYGDAYLTVVISLLQAPVIRINTDAVRVVASASLKFQVNEPTPVDAFTFQLIVGLNVTATIDSNSNQTTAKVVIAPPHDEDIEIRLLQSNIGTFDSDAVANQLSVLLKFAPLFLGDKLVFPVSLGNGTVIVGPVVDLHRGYMYFTGNYTFTPPVQ